MRIDGGEIRYVCDEDGSLAFGTIPEGNRQFNVRVDKSVAKRAVVFADCRKLIWIGDVER